MPHVSFAPHFVFALTLLGCASTPDQADPGPGPMRPLGPDHALDRADPIDVDDQPTMEAWLAARVAAAKAGTRERVRLPLVRRSAAFGCDCPPFAVAARTDNGPFYWIRVVDSDSGMAIGSPPRTTSRSTRPRSTSPSSRPRPRSLVDAQVNKYQTPTELLNYTNMRFNDLVENVELKDKEQTSTKTKLTLNAGRVFLGKFNGRAKEASNYDERLEIMGEGEAPELEGTVGELNEFAGDRTRNERGGEYLLNDEARMKDIKRRSKAER